MDNIKKQIANEVTDTVNQIKKVAQDEEGKKALKYIVDALANDSHKKEAQGAASRIIGMGDDASGFASDASRNAISNVKDLLSIGGSVSAIGLGGGALAHELSSQAEPTQEDLEQILESNPEIERQFDRSEIEKVWGSLKQHIPRTLKQDPYGAGQIMKKMLSVEGFDVSSLDKLMDIEKKKQKQERQVFSTKTSGAKSYLDKLAQKVQEIEKEAEDEENVQERYNELKAVLDG